MRNGRTHFTLHFKFMRKSAEKENIAEKLWKLRILRKTCGYQPPPNKKWPPLATNRPAKKPWPSHTEPNYGVQWQGIRCCFEMLPTLSLLGAAEPFAAPAAFRSRTEAGGVFNTNLYVRSSKAVISTGMIMPEESKQKNTEPWTETPAAGAGC